MPSRKTFLLIDGHAVIYRAFYAIRNLTDKQGKLINAIYGFSRILLKTIQDYEPEYIAVTFDHKGKTFRHKDFKEYKANRSEMPDELKPQIEEIKKFVESMNIPQFEKSGYEADDLIGTISKILDKNHQVLTVIVTGDRDTFQLVDHNTHVWLPGRGKGQSDKEYGPEQVEEKMGVCPELIVDLKALMGDASDNIPGVKGVGPKTAVSLIKQAGNLDKVYEKLDSLEVSKKIKEKLINEKENAYISQKLAQIDLDVPVEFDLKSCKMASYDKAKVTKFFEELGFKSLLNMLPADEFEQNVQDALF
jgi:DNA polymerase I